MWLSVQKIAFWSVKIVSWFYTESEQNMFPVLSLKQSIISVQCKLREFWTVAKNPVIMTKNCLYDSINLIFTLSTTFIIKEFTGLQNSEFTLNKMPDWPLSSHAQQTL